MGSTNNGPNINPNPNPTINSRAIVFDNDSSSLGNA